MRRPRPPRLDLPRVELPKEEADALHRRALAGDTDARNRIVEANLALAGWYLRRFGRRHPGLDSEEIVAAAAAGLVDAAASHDPDRHTSFATTAFYWMRKEVIEAAGQARHVISTPMNYRKAPAYYMRVHGESKSGEALKAFAAMRRRKAERLEGVACRPEPEPAESGEVAELRRRVAALPDALRHAVSLRFDLDCYGMTMLDAAKAAKTHLVRDAIRRLRAGGPIGGRAEGGPGCESCGRPKTPIGRSGWWCRPCRDSRDGIRSRHAFPTGRSGGAGDGTDAA